MGKSLTPVYRIEEWYQNNHHEACAWSVKSYGKPTEDNIARYVKAEVDSYKPNGVNHHIALMFGYIPVPHRAVVIRQSTGRVVAEWNAPAFMEV